MAHVKHWKIILNTFMGRQIGRITTLCDANSPGLLIEIDIKYYN